MNLIKVQNNYSWLVTEDVDLKNKLYRSFRIPDPNRFHNTAYKQGRWDGFKEFFKLNGGMFLTGLLPEVVAGMKLLQKPFQFVDEREKIQWLHTSIDDQFLNQWLPEGVSPLTLYDYQVDYFHQSVRYQRGLITSPTASGKTNVLISIIKSLPPKTPILFVTKNSGLVDQNYQEMKKWGVENLGRFYGNYKEPNHVMCITSHVDTFNSIAKLLPQFKVLIVDEVHECVSAVPLKAYSKMKNAVARFGFSATPFKFGGKDKIHKMTVKGWFGGVFKTTTTETGYLTTKDLQERKILSASRVTVYPIDFPKNITHEPYGDAVTLGIANNFEFHKIVTRLARSLKGRTLILVERLDQGEYLKQLMPEAHWISGSDSLEEKMKVYGDLRVGENVIAIVMRHIVSSGVNVFAHSVCLASGGQAEHNIIQQMGRGLRCAPDKDILDFYDFLFTTNVYLNKHSKNRIKTLAEQGHQVTIKESIDF